MSGKRETRRKKEEERERALDTKRSSPMKNVLL